MKPVSDGIWWLRGEIVMARGKGGRIPAGGHAGLFEKVQPFLRRALKTTERGADDQARRAARRADERLPYSGSGYVDRPQSPNAERAYDRIRNTTGDTERIANNTGIRQDVLDRIKQHIFHTEHRVAVGPNEVRTGRFAPTDHIADLWEKAERGALSPDEATAFRRWAAHEGVESRLMEQGMPYRSAHPDAWEDGVNWPSARHHGAHDLAPNEGARGPFSHYPGMLGREAPDVPIADDLANIDDVVNAIRRGGR